MELKFPEKCQKDDLLKADTIAFNCIKHVKGLCAIDWDGSEEEGACGEVFRVNKHLMTLATLAQHGWGLIRRLNAELTLAADGVVKECGVVATNAHEATLRLADRICLGMSSTFTLAPEDDYRGPGFVDPKEAKAEWEKDLLEPEECRARLEYYKKKWKRRIKHIDERELAVLDKKLQREYYVARNRRAKRAAAGAPPVADGGKAAAPPQGHGGRAGREAGEFGRGAVVSLPR